MDRVDPKHTPGSAADTSRPGLTWGLLIATYNRQQVLPRAVRCAVRQDPPPAEVIIVDGSDDWGQTRSQIEQLLEEEGCKARLVYERAEVLSSTTQRNQGIALAQADVLFMIDDDSLMHRGCARAVLDVFGHADAAGVLGACTGLSAIEPDAATHDSDESVQGGKVNKTKKMGLVGRLTKWFIGEYLPHYDNPKPAWRMPESLGNMFGCFTRREIHGARMVFRRSAVQDQRFDDALTRYSYLEDTDLGYRVGREGVLLTIPGAKICHLGEVGGRLPTVRASTISVTNAAFLTCKNAQHPRENLRRLRRHAIRRSLFVLIKDLKRGDWHIPQARGIWAGLIQTRWIASTPKDQLDKRYMTFQEKLLAKA